MSKTDLDSILMVLENPTRRDIIKRLSEEPNYPLQLAKELGLGQQLVAKHLRVMEEAGIVTSSVESSPHGPKRRIYSLNKSISVTLDVATHLFKAKVVSFDSKPELEKTSEAFVQLMDRMDQTLTHREKSRRIQSFTQIISEIDKRLEALETERSILLYIRNFAMKEASRVIETFKNSDTRRVLYHALDERAVTVKSLSKTLNMREAVVREILSKLKKEFGIGVGNIDEKAKETN